MNFLTRLSNFQQCGVITVHRYVVMCYDKHKNSAELSWAGSCCDGTNDSEIQRILKIATNSNVGL